jgi:predicted dehydrogenase
MACGDSSAGERIRLGYIGIGGQGTGHIHRMIGRRDLQILAVCDVRQTMLDSARELVEARYSTRPEFSHSYKGLACYHDYRDLLARDDIDAVVLAPPDHWHAIIAIDSARAGKDIYCEKPMTLTIAEARAMVRAVRRYGRVFQTGSQQRSDSEFLFACEMVRSGRIGELETINVNVGGPSVDCYLPGEPVPGKIDWDRWLGPAPWRPYNGGICDLYTASGWRSYRDYSGGGMTDWGAHHFDIAQWGMGTDHTGPIEVIPPDGKDVDRLTYKYANGVTVYHGGGRGVRFNGTEGVVEVNRGYLRTWPQELMYKPIGPNETRLYRSPGHYEDWLRCVRTRRRPICDVEIGCRSVTVCHLGNLAYWLKRPLRWNPDEERFVGDDEANRWLDRPKREPWTTN